MSDPHSSCSGAKAPLIPEVPSACVRLSTLQERWHASTRLNLVKVTDALPKDFRTLPGGPVQPIDLLIAWPRSATAIERIENMVYARQLGL